MNFIMKGKNIYYERKSIYILWSKKVNFIINEPYKCAVMVNALLVHCLRFACGTLLGCSMNYYTLFNIVNYS